jgi:hypothetical protein
VRYDLNPRLHLVHALSESIIFANGWLLGVQSLRQLPLAHGWAEFDCVAVDHGWLSICDMLTGV